MVAVATPCTVWYAAQHRGFTHPRRRLIKWRHLRCCPQIGSTSSDRVRRGSPRRRRRWRGCGLWRSFGRRVRILHHLRGRRRFHLFIAHLSTGVSARSRSWGSRWELTAVVSKLAWQRLKCTMCSEWTGPTMPLADHCSSSKMCQPRLGAFSRCGHARVSSQRNERWRRREVWVIGGFRSTRQ